MPELVSYFQEQMFFDEYLSQIVPLVKERVEKSEDFICLRRLLLLRATSR